MNSQNAHHSSIAGSAMSEMADRVQGYDWSSTPLGPMDRWPQSLRTVVNILLTSRYSMWMGWGKDLTFFYNDAYAPTLGIKHPWALGLPASQVWAEIWADIYPRIETVLSTTRATYDEGLLLFLERSGFPEETYHTFSYSPLENDLGEISGMLCVVTEETERVIGARRLGLLRELATRTAKARSSEAACALTLESLETDTHDIPFAQIYLLDHEHRKLIAADASSDPTFELADLGLTLNAAWHLAESLDGESQVTTFDLPEGSKLPLGAWDKPAKQAFAAAIRPSGEPGRTWLLIAGINPYQIFDASYRGFVDLMTRQIGAAIAIAKSYEEERQRAESLAALDRAKTVFFSNVSHEFRTPLTLMLGPLEEALGIGGETRELVSVAHRNGLRLLKLVNTLLDFSRIEAGRTQATYVRTNLAALTHDLASSFRTATDRAGLQLNVMCDPDLEPVYVDRDMWEKIVLNLISNAFKFTLEGEIEVTLRRSADRSRLELEVRDTGIGIPEAELTHIFDRFHRVEGRAGRSHEGSGIGLALVLELVKLHGGTIAVDSKLDQGTAFIVSIPIGIAHLPQERIDTPSRLAPTSAGSRIYVEEALRWLPNSDIRSDFGEAAGLDGSLLYDDSLDGGTIEKARVLVVDDNSDMRNYVGRLLSKTYDITLAADGAEALDSVRRDPPDLILTDVMMPRLDGFGLLKSLRADPATQTIPIIMLSARAGEEARMEGLEAGADDYLVKPFTAREMEARIKGALSIAKLRRESRESERRRAAQFETLYTAAPLGVYLIDDAFRVREVNPIAAEVFGSEVIGRDFGEVLRTLWSPEFAEDLISRFRHTLATGEPYESPEYTEQRIDRGVREYYEWQINRIPLPEGTHGVVCYFRDISRQVFARIAVAESEARLRFMAESMPQKIFTATPTGTLDYVNQQWSEFTGVPGEEIQRLGWKQFVHPEDLEENVRAWEHSIAYGDPFQLTHRFRRSDGAYRWHLSRAHAMRDAEGRISMWIGSSTDVHAQKEKEEELRHLNDDLQQFAYSASHDLQEPIRNVAIFSEIIAERVHEILDAESRQFLGFITEGAQRLARLIDDLLAYTRAGTLEGNLETISSGAVLQRTLEGLSEAVRESGATVTNDSLPEVVMAEAHLQQVFQNLIGNAIKYGPPDGPKIHVSAQELDGGWKFSVADNGIGIDPQYKEKIFGVFKRLNNDGKHAGTGIGLAICQRVVERYGGRIWVESEPGKGSVFFFTVPSAFKGADGGSHEHFAG